MFYRWRRVDEEGRTEMWRLYGWFTALMACGSCVGAVAWAALMMNLVNFYEGQVGSNDALKTSLVALAYSWRAVFSVTYAIDFLCLSAAKLMVLDRMSVFAAPQGTRLQKRWALAGWVVMAAVVLGNAVGLAANAAAAFYYHKAALAQGKASTYYAQNNTKDGLDSKSLTSEALLRAGAAVSVQLLCEVAVLLLVIIAFVVVAVFCARHFSSSLAIFDAAAQRASMGRALRLQMSAAAATGRMLRLHMLGTTAFVFVAFVLRSLFSTMHAVAFQLRSFDKGCPGGVCASCQNMYGHIVNWINYTPEFQLMIMLISSPVALLVALWGVTSNSTLQLMKAQERGSATPLSPAVKHDTEAGEWTMLHLPQPLSTATTADTTLARTGT
jgi:hypothetical protein